MTEQIAWKLDSIHPFTHRQGQIVEGIANGGTYGQIAMELGISEQTIKNIMRGSGRWEPVMGKKSPRKSRQSGIQDIIEGLTGIRLPYKKFVPFLIEMKILVPNLNT